jgi:hypothetical protein
VATRTGSGTVGTVVRTVATVLVLVVVAAGAIWLWGRHEALPPQGDPPLGQAARKPADPMAIADFAGVRQHELAYDDFTGAATLLTPGEIKAYLAGGPQSIRMAVGYLSGGTADVVVVRMAGPAQARQAERALTALQLGFGFTAAPHPPAGVSDTVLGAVPDQPTVLPGGRAHYVHGDLLVRVEFRGPGVAAAQREFAGIVAQQLRALPADGSDG